jgi:predicted NAD/FAD-dependent oxidoreductase
VYQGSAKFSRRRLDQDPATWTRAILAEAARLFGEWAEEPSFTQAHRWRFGRANAFPLSSPLLLRFSGGAALGLAGECFHPALGVEGAFLSGRALARRLLDR